MTAWPVAPLGDVALINPPLDVQPDRTSMVSFVPLASLDAVAAIAHTESARAYEEVAKGYTPFVDGEILVAKITPSFQNCKIGQAQLDHEIGMGSTEFHVIRPGEHVDPRYILHFLRQDWVLAAGESRMTGSGGQRRVPASFLSELPIPLPPLAEQRRIAGILDAADALRAKRRESIALLDTLNQSIFHDMFGGGTVEDHVWPHERLGNLLDYLTSGSRGWAKYYADQGDLFLRIQNVGGGKVTLDDVARVKAPYTAEARRTEAMEGDVLLSITADLGRTAVIPSGFGRAYVNQHLAILRSGRIQAHFLAHYLESPGGRGLLLRRNREGVKAGLNFEDIRSLPVPFPPIGLQKQFSEAVIKAESQVLANESDRKKLDSLFSSLQTRAFRGEL